MCGRFTQSHDRDAILRRFRIDLERAEIQPAYNVAPGSGVPVVVSEGSQRVLEHFRWGLPRFAKRGKAAPPLFNARVETVATNSLFRPLLTSHRCLVPADGFYEWQDPTTGKRPFRIRLVSDEPFAFAGLWQEASPGGLPTFTLITTAPNEVVAPIHNRMPVILSPECEDAWLDSREHNAAHLKTLLRPTTAPMAAYEVSRVVNSVANQGPECMEPAREHAPAQLRLV